MRVGDDLEVGLEDISGGQGGRMDKVVWEMSGLCAGDDLREDVKDAYGCGAMR